MNGNVTQQDLLVYIYGESSVEESEIVKNALIADPLLMQTYYELLEVKRSLDTINVEPNPTSIAIITEYSHDSHTEAV